MKKAKFKPVVKNEDGGSCNTTSNLMWCCVVGSLFCYAYQDTGMHEHGHRSLLNPRLKIPRVAVLVICRRVGVSRQRTKGKRRKGGKGRRKRRIWDSSAD